MELIPIDEIHRRAKRAGLTIKALCEQADVPRATWQVWRTKCPLTLVSYTRIIEVLEKAESEACAGDGA